ncbi:hypothetical protein JT06_05740 [Desulfobulbus sp. Tol-SR]|jgi:hypothetical protein|nr:hypothetical protein JT06_05740 [Desulfobulbus sp. Tol-SR]
MITAKDTDRMRTTTSFPVPVLLACLLLSLLLLGGCSSRGYINLKIHSEPEGSFLVYKIDKLKTDQPSPWIYLGQTPFAGVSLIEGDEMDSGDRVSFKVMRNGYLDQVKEWSGEQFLDEYDEQGVIFWTPRLIKSNQ